jgi:hypothetical protein
MKQQHKSVHKIASPSIHHTQHSTMSSSSRVVELTIEDDDDSFQTIEPLADHADASPASAVRPPAVDPPAVDFRALLANNDFDK